jgi:hypothetical protein
MGIRHELLLQLHPFPKSILGYLNYMTFSEIVNFHYTFYKERRFRRYLWSCDCLSKSMPQCIELVCRRLA